MILWRNLEESAGNFTLYCVASNMLTIIPTMVLLSECSTQLLLTHLTQPSRHTQL